jgi:WD40 repeat protein
MLPIKRRVVWAFLVGAASLTGGIRGVDPWHRAQAAEGAKRDESAVPGAPAPEPAHRDLTAVGGQVMSLAFSPDGKLLASASYAQGQGSQVELRDVASAKVHRVLEAHGRMGRFICVQLTFSPDGKTLATASMGERLGAHEIYSEIKLWDIGTGKEKWAVEEDGWAHCVAFAPDGKTLVNGVHLGNGAAKLKVRDAATGKEQRAFEVAGLSPLTAAFSPDGKTLVCCGLGLPTAKLVILDVRSGDVKHSYFGDADNSYTTAAISPDGKLLAASGPGSGDIQVWDLATGNSHATWEGFGKENGDRKLAFSPDGKMLAVIGSNAAVKLIDVASGKVLASLKGHDEVRNLGTLTFSRDGRTLASSRFDGVIRLWRIGAAAGARE